MADKKLSLLTYEFRFPTAGMNPLINDPEFSPRMIADGILGIRYSQSMDDSDLILLRYVLGSIWFNFYRNCSDLSSELLFGRVEVWNSNLHVANFVVPANHYESTSRSMFHRNDLIRKALVAELAEYERSQCWNSDPDEIPLWLENEWRMIFSLSQRNS